MEGGDYRSSEGRGMNSVGGVGGRAGPNIIKTEVIATNLMIKRDHEHSTLFVYKTHTSSWSTEG